MSIEIGVRIISKNMKILYVPDNLKIGKTTVKKLDLGKISVEDYTAGKKRQLSQDWINVVKQKIPRDGETARELRKLNIRLPKTAIAGIDKKTGTIVLIPVIVNNKL